METVRVFKSGNSQAVRIPKEFATEDTELFIQKVGCSLVLTSPKHIWEGFETSIEEFSEDLFENGREQPAMQVRDDL
ncbi:MAG: AbrB/MazE/SpoVT family DNA-binding domain-containing protein [Deltaproteobacteria bacterium]|nr:AbrB/MazE/SpoVT family DNA-binding domain-containing protein [Deltaproteobacteria bacterium]MBN2673033.1 AbrB/MazE/SpoVT family DNA-binding domain-containing protein [Deltaproteobacteria bacterium]